MAANNFVKAVKKKWNDNSLADGLLVKRRSREFVFNIFTISLIIGLCFAILYPIIKIFPVIFNDVEDLGSPDIVWVPIRWSVISFKAAIRLVFGNFVTMAQSLLYSAVIAAIQVFVCSMAGYTLGRIKSKFNDIIFILVIVTFVVPPQSLLISQYLRFKQFDVFGLFKLFTGSTIDLINQPITLFILAFFGFGLKQSLFVFQFRQFFKGLPGELEEAAYIDGCGFYQTFFRIALPNAVPAIMTVSILSFVWNYGDTYYTGYFHPKGPYLSIALNQTFASTNANNVVTAVQTWYDKPGATTFAFDAVKQAAALIYLAPLLIIYFLIQKRFVENFERSGIVG